MTLTLKPASTYLHTQSTPAVSWVVDHCLGTYPAIDVYVSMNGQTQKILPLHVTHSTVNRCTVTFTEALSGYATVG